MTKADVGKFIKNTKASLSKHSPEILFGLGITGMAVSTVLAVKATPKALRLIEEFKKAEQKDELTPVETVKATWKCYIPAALTGISSASCLICANSIHLKRSAALAAAYKISETALTEYREKVIETVGEKKEEIIRENITKKRLEENPVSNNEVIVTKKGKTLFYDHLSGRYFESDIDLIKKAVNELNRKMLSWNYASLNDFYDEIGLPHIDLGELVGWNIDKMLDVDFGPGMTEDQTPCLVLDYPVAPHHGYSKNF